MSNLYPKEVRPVAPPSYAEATYNSQTLPIGNSMYVGTQAAVYGELPIRCTCPNCCQIIVSRVEKKTGLLTWMVCGGVALLGGFLGCCLVPFCIDSLKDIQHYCSNFQVLLGVKKML